jgi:hypothetical protein
MTLNIETYTLTPQLISESFEISKHSGKQLRKLTVALRANEMRAKDDLIKFGSDRVVAKVEGLDRPEIDFTISSSSYSYRDGSPVTTFTWELTEIEVINVKTVYLENIRLSPYHYFEEFDDKGHLSITMRVELNDEEERSLRDLPLYFAVTREGISVDPLDMRFGQIIWSQSHDKYKLHLNIVDKRVDDGGINRGLFSPTMGNMEVAISKGALRLDSILEKLVEKNVITLEEKEEILTPNKTALALKTRQLDRVDDIDDFEPWEQQFSKDMVSF